MADRRLSRPKRRRQDHDHAHAYLFFSSHVGNRHSRRLRRAGETLEVKRRIGYLPEIPPRYSEMRTAEYLAFVGQIKGLRGKELTKRFDYVLECCSVADVRFG